MRKIHLQYWKNLSVSGPTQFKPLLFKGQLERNLLCFHFFFFYSSPENIFSLLLFLVFKNILFSERGREGEREGEKHQCVVASCVSAPAPHPTPTGDLACHPGMCPYQELNPWPPGLQAAAQSTEPHQPGHIFFIAFRERGWKRETEGEEHWCERETLVGCLLLVSWPGDWTAT